jgi:hypothetical protein
MVNFEPLRVSRHISTIDLKPYKAEIDSEWASNYRSPKSRGERSKEQVLAHVTQGKYGEALLREFSPEMVRVSDFNCHKFLSDKPWSKRLFVKKDGCLVNWEYNDLIDTERKIIIEVKTWSPKSLADRKKCQDVTDAAVSKEWLFADEIYFFCIEHDEVWLQNIVKVGKEERDV